MERKWVSKIIVGYLNLASFRAFVLSKAVVCSLSFNLYDGASFFGFVVWVALVLTVVGMGLIGNVRITSFCSLVPLKLSYAR